jgi:hypothetical protein
MLIGVPLETAARAARVVVTHETAKNPGARRQKVVSDRASPAAASPC